MKKFTFTGLLTALMLFAGTAFGQVIASDDFEAYQTGQQLAAQAYAAGNTNWVVWGADPGDAPDPYVESIGGSKAVYLIQDKDVVLLTDERYTAGTFSVEWDYYIETGKIGYFNILKDFFGDDAVWGTQLFFREDGTGYIDADGSASASFTYTQATWNHFKAILDLDNDNAKIYLGDDLLVEFEWSAGCFGEWEEPGLAAMNFYGMPGSSIEPATTAPCGYYIDNIMCQRIGEPLPPPVISLDPDGPIELTLKPEATTTTKLVLNNEDAGTLKAVWSTYIEYTPLEEGTESDFNLSICDPVALVNSAVGGNTIETTREIAMRLSPSHYIDKLGGEIKEVAFFILDESDEGNDMKPASDLTFRIYGQGTSDNDAGEILAETVLKKEDFILLDWNWVDIGPVKLTGGDYWVAVEMVQAPGSYPLSTSDGYVQDGGDMWRLQGGKWSRASTNPNLTNNWAIQASGKGKTQRIWGTMDKIYGSTPAASSTEFTITFNSKNYPLGTYESTLIMMTNDPNNEKFEIPLTMIVNDGAIGTSAEITGINVDGQPTEQLPDDETIYMITVPFTEEVVIEVITVDPKAMVTGEDGTQAVVVGENVFNIKVTAEDGVTEKDYQLGVIVEKKEGIDDVEKVLVSIHPNPVQDKLYFDAEKQIQNVQIFDLNGRMIQEVKVSGDAIDVKELASGVYLVKIFTAEGNVTHKIIKK